MKVNIFLVLAVAITGCSSLESTQVGREKDNDGLIYYMPKKDILVKIIIAKGQITSVTMEATTAYPDKSQAYLLKFKGNMTGKNVGNIGVDTNGLLASTQSTATSGVSDIFQSLGKIAGSAVGLSSATAITPKPTCGDGTHSFILQVDSPGYQNGEACGLNVDISKKFDTTSRWVRGSTDKSGIYYRQAQPYQVDVRGAYNVSAIVFSPSESPTSFLPISKTFFANGDADFGFVDGMPTKYNQTTDGEVVGLLTIPATVISAYFSAIGSIFDSFKSTDDKNSEALLASSKLEMEKVKFTACAEAIKAKDDTVLAKLGCAN